MINLAEPAICRIVNYPKSGSQFSSRPEGAIRTVFQTGGSGKHPKALSHKDLRHLVQSILGNKILSVASFLGGSGKPRKKCKVFPCENGIF